MAGSQKPSICDWLWLLDRKLEIGRSDVNVCHDCVEEVSVRTTCKALPCPSDDTPCFHFLDDPIYKSALPGGLRKSSKVSNSFYLEWIETPGTQGSPFWQPWATQVGLLSSLDTSWWAATNLFLKAAFQGATVVKSSQCGVRSLVKERQSQESWKQAGEPSAYYTFITL